MARSCYAHARASSSHINFIDLGNQFVFYRTLKGYFGVELGHWFQLDMAGKRVHPLKLFKPRTDNVQLALR